MKSRYIRCLSVVSAALLAGLPAGAAERLCSVYLESVGALQLQLQKAAEVFESPELSMFPMMMTMMVPGAGQINAEEPISLHVFDLGGGIAGGIVELTPATTAEMFLKALTAASGKPLEPAVNGRFNFDGGVAQVVGTRLLLARSAADLEACTGSAVPALPPIPAVEGTIRVAMAPSAAIPMLNILKAKRCKMSGAAGTKEAQAKEIMDICFGLYARTLAQINALEIGLAVQDEGLVIRKRIAAKAGSTIAGIITSMSSASPDYRSFVTPNSFLSVATGSYTVPESLKNQVVALYIKMMKMSPMLADIEDVELTALMEQSMAMIGAPLAFELKTPENWRMLMQGVIGMSDAAAYLEKMAETMQSTTYQKMIACSGMKITEPVKRAYKDAAVYSWSFSFDQEALQKAIEVQTPGMKLDEHSLGTLETAMHVFGNTYEYGATPRALAFGMGSSAMVERAIDQLNGEDQSLTEVLRIQKLLSPTVAPAIIGRFAVVEAARLAMKLQCGGTLPADIQNAPSGEGIVFADWIENGDVKTAMLIPAADVKALRVMTQAMKNSLRSRADVEEPSMNDDQEDDADEPALDDEQEGNADEDDSSAK